MDLEHAVIAAAHDAPTTAIEALTAVQDELAAHGVTNANRFGHLIGQCAHESLRFTQVVESLFYTTTDRLMAVFGRYFSSRQEASGFLRNSEKVANRTYSNRMGNGPETSGDGFRFRGRGYLQLTGRSNYRIFGERIGVDLENQPELASDPKTSWLIAGSYFANRSRSGKTTLEWADENNVERVTLIVNGGLNGLGDRQNRTARARQVLHGEPLRPTLKLGDEGHPVMLLQRALARRGVSPGAIDGDFGPMTHAAVKTFQTLVGLANDGVVGTDTWAALEPLAS